MQKKQNIFITILENLTILMIFLVLIQTFLEDLSIYLGLPIEIVNKIKLTAFIFDAYFTIEFFSRFISALIQKNGIDYFFYKNGWIDLLASLPLLLLISGPELLFQVYGINLLSISFINKARILKAIKAIRVARILRLIRILKIFGKIKNVKSTMVQRHISIISTIVVTSIIFCFMITSFLQEIKLLPSRYDDVIKKEESSNNLFIKIYRLTDKENLVSFFNYAAKEFPNIITIKLNEEVKYQSKNINHEYYKYYEKVNNTDFIETYKLKSLSDILKITYWRIDYYKSETFFNMINFILIIFILLSIIIIYSRHFALTISDPIFVMRMGFEIRDYTYAVKILKHYENDDIFILANDYNDRWLPAKIRKLSELNVSTTKLTINDITDKG